MDISELIETKYRILQDKYLDEHMLEILDAINSNPEKIVIKCREIDLLEAGKVNENPTYLSDEYLRFVDDGISILTASSEFFDKIKNYIPRTIKELTVPKDCLTNLEFLKEFPNLETLTISDYSTFETDELEYIKNNTNIKKIDLRSSRTFDIHQKKQDYTIISGGYNIADYKGLRLINKPSYLSWRARQYAYINSYMELDILKQLYSEIRNEMPNIVDLTIYEKNTKENNVELNIDNDNNNAEIKFNHISAPKAANVFHTINQDLPVKKAEYHTENETLEDDYYLNSIARNTNLMIRYKGSIADTTLDEFKGMRETIDYYKGIIEEANLSPVEQVAYVYDILKTWRYQENPNDKDRARSLHGIIADGTIVCVGYATFAKQLLTALGIKTASISPTIPTEKNPYAGHQRNLVRIDDDKYNIHGLYALDITWDSDRDVSVILDENGNKLVVARPSDKDKVIDYYNNLSLYRNFLIPLSNYDSRFPNEINPQIIEQYKNNHARNLVEKSRLIENNPKIIPDYIDKIHAELFDSEEGILTVDKYITAEKPSLESFVGIITTVRKAEGYSEELAIEDVTRVVELHNMINDQNPDQPNHFFKSTSSK